MGERLRVEHLRAEPGQRVDGYLNGAEMQDGSPARAGLPLHQGGQRGL